MALPSVVVAGLAAWWRFDVEFSLDWPLLITGALLVTVMATAVGYAIAVTLPAMLAQVVSQVMVFFVLMFSPRGLPGGTATRLVHPSAQATAGHARRGRDPRRTGL